LSALPVFNYLLTEAIEVFFMAEVTRMDYVILPEPLPMTIEAMKPHWALLRFDLWGNSMVIFKGQMKIDQKDMIDLKEFKRGALFPKGEMLHFVIEHFDDDTEKGVLRQNILVNIAEEKLSHRLSGRRIIRWGDDLYDEDRRITLTAVSKTPVSVKIHFGLCIETDSEAGYTGLKEYDLDVHELAEVVGNQYRADMKRLAEKCWRLRPVT
jgi:uncharacterized protein